MTIRIALIALVALAAGPTFAGDTLYGVSAGGGIYELNRRTGHATIVAGTGHEANAAASYDGFIYTAGGSGIDQDSIFRFDPRTNTTSLFLSLFGDTNGGITGLAFGSDGALFALWNTGSGEIDLIAGINAETGEVDVIGETGLTRIQSLAFGPDDTLYFGDLSEGLGTLSLRDGSATIIGGPPGDWQGIEFTSDGTLYGGRQELFEIDPRTGQSTVIGPTNLDLRGLAAVTIPAPPAAFGLLILFVQPRRRRE